MNNSGKASNVTEKAAAFYAKALKTTHSECCGAAKPALAQDYQRVDLRTVPDDAVTNSFGCGDPLNFAAIQPGQTVLDLGSGAGLDLILAAQRVGPKGKAIGLDVSEEMIERAKLNVAAANLDNVEFKQGIIEDMPIAEHSVDWVISNCVINLSPNKPRVFEEIVRVLKPGGRILVSDIVADDLPSWVLENETFHAACIAGAMEEGEYLKIAEDAGLGEVEILDRLTYDGSMLSVLMQEELPIEIDAICEHMQIGPEALVKLAATELDGKVHSIKVAGRRLVL